MTMRQKEYISVEAGTLVKYIHVSSDASTGKFLQRNLLSSFDGNIRLFAYSLVQLLLGL